MAFETFEHGADIGIRGIGKTLEQAFEEGAKAMFSLMVEDLSQVVPKDTIEIQCDAMDLEMLFVAYLNSLLAESDINNFIFSSFQVEIQDLNLKSKAMGEPFDPKRHVPGVGVKGATLTALAVEQKDGYWVAQCIVDV